MSVLTVEETSTHPYRELVRHTPWVSVVLLAVLTSFVDGFAMISLREAVGYIGRAQSPFHVWLQSSALYLPVFVLAVWGAFLLARRWRAGRHPKLVTTALITVATSLVALIITAINAAYDYQLQVAQMTRMMATGGMTGMESALADSLHVQFVALGLASVVFLVANLVVVAWVTALRGGRLGAVTA